MLPALPLSAAVSAEARLAYVLRHFRAAYAHVPEVTVGYQDAQVQLNDGAGAFFAQTNPYPPEPAWREWQDRKLPFFFGPPSDKPLLELLAEDRAYLHADVISAAFYLLSGWQEYYSKERDRHGRFPYSASVQCRYGFVAVPVVNYYFDLLKAAVEHVSGQPCRPRRWAGGAPFAAFITHDIDNLYSAWKAPAKAAWQRRAVGSFGRQLWQHFTRSDAWDNLALVQQTVAEYGAKSTFFFLPQHRKAANGTPNADYHLRRNAIEHQIHSLAAAGSEIAVHGSIGTSGDPGKLVIDVGHIRKILRQPFDSEIALGNRFHYLKWEPSLTPLVLESGLVSYDSTLGFAEHFGFRNSCCHPFYPFNFATGEACAFLEIPLNVMDATLYHPNYLRLAPEEILSALTPMFQEIERFGGVSTVLWHNENFDPANLHNGPQQFHVLMEYLRSRHAAFLTGRDICALVKEGV